MAARAASVAGVARRPGDWTDAVARWAPAIILAHQALFVLLRALTPGGLGLDEAEQMVATQSLALGYGPQPPLYTWLQIAVFQITGPGKLGLALLKHGLIAVFATAVWSGVLALSGDRRVAMAAAFCLMLAPPIGWEAHRALTHTVLALTAGALVFRALIACRQGGRPIDFALLGVAMAAGLLSKWNILFLYVGLGVALALDDRRSDRRSDWRGYAASAALAAALVAPSLWWILDHRELALQDVRKFDLGEGGDPLAARVSGLFETLEGVASFLPLVIAAAGLAVWRRPADRSPRAPAPGLRFVATALAGAIAAVLVVVLVSGAGDVKERWLTPFMFLAPVCAALWAGSRLDAVGAGRIARIALAASAVALAALAVNRGVGADKPPHEATPFAALAAAMPLGPATLALADGDFTGGNLRHAAPGLSVATPHTAAPGRQGVDRVVLVWRGGAGAPPPAALLALFEALFGRPAPALAPQRAEAPHRWPHGDKLYALNWATVEIDGKGTE